VFLRNLCNLRRLWIIVAFIQWQPLTESEARRSLRRRSATFPCVSWLHCGSSNLNRRGNRRTRRFGTVQPCRGPSRKPS